MKKTITTLFVCLGLLAPFFHASAQDGGDPPTDILITEGGSTGGGPIAHAPALIPIQAAYYPSITTILVDFLYDLGQVSVEIENETTGAYSQTTINAMQGVQPFLITGTSGHWTITFALPGSTYFGEFDIF